MFAVLVTVGFLVAPAMETELSTYTRISSEFATYEDCVTWLDAHGTQVGVKLVPFAKKVRASGNRISSIHIACKKT